MECRADGMSAQLKFRATGMSRIQNVAHPKCRANGCRAEGMLRKEKVAQMAFPPTDSLTRAVKSL